VLILSHRKLLLSKAMVVNVAETSGQISGMDTGDFVAGDEVFGATIRPSSTAAANL
jgi:hypothetical protein